MSQRLKAKTPEEGDLVKARPRQSTGWRYEYGVLAIGAKGGFSVNGVPVHHRGTEVVRGYERRLLKIFLKTEGHCHFCGDVIDFEKRGWDIDLTGRWEVDHIVQRKKKGASREANYLPACTRCNRLRWSRTGPSLRRVIFLGLVAKDEAYYNPGSSVGSELRKLRLARLAENWKRRMRKSLSPSAYKRAASRIPSLIEDATAFEKRALERYQRELKRKRKGRVELSSVELDVGGPRKSHVSWSDTLEEVRRSRDTPLRERKAEATLRE